MNKLCFIYHPGFAHKMYGCADINLSCALCIRSRVVVDRANMLVATDYGSQLILCQVRQLPAEACGANGLPRALGDC